MMQVQNEPNLNKFVVEQQQKIGFFGQPTGFYPNTYQYTPETHHYHPLPTKEGFCEPALFQQARPQQNPAGFTPF